MATTRPRSRKPAVGSSGSKSPWYPIFVVSMLAVGLSFVILLFVASDSFGGGGDGGGPALPGASDTPADATNAPTTDRGETATASPEAPTPTPNPTGPPAPNGDTSPLLTCGDILAPLNKGTRLAPDCAPNDLQTVPDSMAEGFQQLRADALGALTQMVAAAQKDGFRLSVGSSYRSYATQVDTYNYWVAQGGQVQADRTSARPGHSEHQMGTTADMCGSGRCLESITGTPEARWIEENSWKFGFVVSYPSGSEPITGYAYEPWHIRFVGIDTAARVRESGKTLHEYLAGR